MRTSTRLDDTDSQTFYWLGRALMVQRKYSGAMAAFTTATDLNPQDAESFSDLGLVRMAQGHASDAAKAAFVNPGASSIAVIPEICNRESIFSVSDGFRLTTCRNDGTVVGDITITVHSSQF